MWTCPFCGRTDRHTDEHVWADWLRQYPMFEVMNEGYTGQRFQRSEWGVERDAEGRYQEVERSRRHVQSFLPYFTVTICDPCNTGWMSQMENRAKAILDPMIRGQSVVLGRDEQTLLAGWVAKFGYAYLSELDPQNVPFSTEEFRALRAAQKPPGRAVIWMGHSTAPQAWISADVKPYFAAGPVGTADPTSPPTTANVFVTAHSVVFIGQWLPDEDDLDAWQNRHFTKTTRAGLRRIWPFEADIEWPTEDIPEDQLNEQWWFMYRFFEAMAIPSLGHTDEEVRQMEAEFWAGADLAELREKWGGLEP